MGLWVNNLLNTLTETIGIALAAPQSYPEVFTIMGNSVTDCSNFDDQGTIPVSSFL